MGIYNCAYTLEESIDSLLAQTITDWQLIMCDDDSVDETYHVAMKYALKDPDKFIVIRNGKNMGLNYTLNQCLKYASGEYIARMDGDDTCHPSRFEKELRFLEMHPHIAIVSTNMALFDESGTWGLSKYKECPEPKDLVVGTPFCHAAAMVRKEALDAVEGYSTDEKLLRIEDYHLWIKMYTMGYRGYNIQEPLYSMRDDHKAAQRKKYKYRINEARVKIFAVHNLKLRKINYLYCLRPLILGVLPIRIYSLLHKIKRGMLK